MLASKKSAMLEVINDNLQQQLSEDVEDVKVHITHMAEVCAVQTTVYTIGSNDLQR